MISGFFVSIFTVFVQCMVEISMADFDFLGVNDTKLFCHEMRIVKIKYLYSCLVETIAEFFFCCAEQCPQWLFCDLLACRLPT
jgi:hypothetical protein